MLYFPQIQVNINKETIAGKQDEVIINELGKKKIKIKDFSICGGVAANQYINDLLKNFIEDKGIAYHQVPMAYCTDNAAMIGWNAIEILKSSKNKFNNYNVRPSPNTLIHENF